MLEDGPGCLLVWPPRGSPRQWLLALGTVGALAVILYFLFSTMGW